ncbi:hypothetical protein [Cohnella zeiphila]|uniref:Glycosyl hydrolase-like 10 domain-containing protein n=1 Tax=Cohnella zeiphila TaxID=2761120 RepID=A0A7X0VUC5_9BACL|nr:hypothetical protein [Cohnella zeiphila]MBB6730869.1 hypothetical protein [Cohnella zeiphila]
MFKGFMDHWVPTRDNLTTFWKQDLPTVLTQLDELKRDVDYNHFTFYTKWITNGIKSNLPFMHNHPKASNVKTDNQWGNAIIDHLHKQGCSVGAMMQLMIFEQPEWGDGMEIGQWDVPGGGTAEPVKVADFTHEDYPTRLAAIIREHLKLFPGLDYLFLEFEGLDHAGDVSGPYKRWAEAQGKPPLDQVSYDDETLAYCRILDVPLGVLWSREVREMLKYYYARNMDAADAVLKEMNFRGKVGIVYHLYEYEAFIYPDVIKDRMHWWLLPWHYWTFRPGTKQIQDQRKLVGKDLLKQWKDAGHSVCYIGDATIGAIRGDRESIPQFYEHCEDLELEGYLGMGNPDPRLGLRWNSVSDQDCLDARELYARLYGKR